ncbi:MAG: M50 family metallopeptidase [Gemmatimonadota bacterium]|nr:M50 family metallopeptidase [Gemmatimonadota bacterium]
MNEQSKRRLRFLAVFAAYFVGLWFLWNTAFVYPIKLFVVLLHEISHGVAAVLTGGRIDAIDITPMQGGVCQCGGGSAFLTLSAGYLGSLLWGGLMIWGAVKLGRRAEWLTAAIGVLAASITLLFIRQPFALAFGLAFGAVLVTIGLKVGTAGNRAVLMGLGMTSALYAVLDIKSDIIDRPEVLSDARMLSQLTAIPTLAWGVIWIGLAIAFCVLLFRWAWKEIA